MTDFSEHEDGLLPVESDAEEPMSMTLSGIGGGEVLPDDPELEPTSYAGGNLLSHSAILLAAVAVVAVGSLYLMRSLQGDLSASDEAQEIEAKIANTLDRLNTPSLLQADDPLRPGNLHDLLASTDDITAIFGHDVRDQQVPIEQVKKDPFSLVIGESDSLHVKPDTTSQQNDRRAVKLQREFTKLELQSIMMGARNIAVIGGEFYKRGDRIGSFTVTDIDKLTVYLQAAGSTFQLTLESNLP